MGDKEIINTYRKGLCKDVKSEALHMAASGGHSEIIKYLQSKGCDVSVKDKVIDLLSEVTLLHMAASGRTYRNN